MIRRNFRSLAQNRGMCFRIATINAARWRGADATEGTIEKGKVAEGIEA